MKVSVLQENLAKGLAVVGPAANPRSTLPVLGNVLLTTDGGRLKLAATNLEVGISCWIAATVTGEGGITLPRKTLTDLVATLPKDRVDMALNETTQTLNLCAGRTEANIKGIAAQDFPDFSSPTAGTVIRVGPELRVAIHQAAIAAAAKEDRPVLTGVLMKFVGDQLTLATADGFRLSVRTLTLPEPVAKPLAVIVPARSLTELVRISGEQVNPITITIEKDSKIHFALRDITLTSQLIPGNFPDYQQIVPARYNTKTVVDTALLSKACRAARVFARDAANIVRLHAKNGTDPATLTVSAISAETGDDTSVMDATVEGDEIQIAFNVEYLVDFLSTVETSQVALETNTGVNPGVIRPVGGEDFVYIIMPMHLGQVVKEAKE